MAVGAQSQSVRSPPPLACSMAAFSLSRYRVSSSSALLSVLANGGGGGQRGTFNAADCRGAKLITLTAPTHFWCIFLTCCSLYYFTFYSLSWQRHGLTHGWEREFVIEGQREAFTGRASHVTADDQGNTCIKKIKFAKVNRKVKLMLSHNKSQSSTPCQKIIEYVMLSPCR